MIYFFLHIYENRKQDKYNTLKPIPQELHLDPNIEKKRKILYYYVFYVVTATTSYDAFKLHSQEV